MKANPFKYFQIEKDMVWPIVSILKFVGLILLLVFILIAFPSLYLAFFNGNEQLEKAVSISETFKTTGSIGDTLNGILTPFIGALAVGTTFLAFLVQYQANQKQRKDLELERFERKFYELLNLHKANVNEINIQKKEKGREALVKIYEELRFIYFTIIKCMEEWNTKKYQYKLGPRIHDNPEAFLDLAFTILFFGVDNSRHGGLILHHQVHSPFMIDVLNELRKIRKVDLDGNLLPQFEETQRTNQGDAHYKCDYVPFEGYVNQLSHYYRHLYITVKFIAGSDKIEPESKYEFLKIIRAQLSNHEQTLLYYNSFWGAGVAWWEDKDLPMVNPNRYPSYFIDYRIIKNVPFNLAYFGIRPADKFAKILKSSKYNIKEENLKEELANRFEWME